MKQALLFLKKKKAGRPRKKDFYESGPLALQNPGSWVVEVFCVAFFQKSGFFTKNPQATRGREST
jgi:hypothetical protein